MANIFDYFDWRGDLTFDQDPFHEVDGMILSEFSYAPFELIKDKLLEQPVTVAEVCELLFTLPDLEDKVVLKDDVNLLQAMMDSPRYRDLKLYDFSYTMDLDHETQFSAVTIQFAPDLYFVAFRGTDHTFVGWKEDFNMTFLFPVPAQKKALEYLEKTAARRSGRLIAGGHSKGGNLAVYAAAFCSSSLQDRILSVYNYDGPGFNAEVLDTPGYQAICDKITTYVPQSSIVGLLLEHEERYIIVHSSQPINLLQHMVYNWDITRNHFDHVEEVSRHSRFLDTTIKTWIADMDCEHRERFVEAIYQILTETNLLSFKELSENWFSNAKSLVKTMKNLDDDTKKAVTKTLKAFMKTAKDGAVKILRNKIKKDKEEGDSQ